MSQTHNVNALLANVQKLSGPENYFDWVFQMRLILTRAGVWGVVNGSIAKPALIDTASLADWTAKSAEGYTAIGLALKPDQVIHIRDCTDAPSAWSALERVYLRNSSANRISLKRRLYGTRHDPKDSIHIYINNITNLASQLHAMGVNIGDEDITDVLIFNLPSSYDPVATALMTRHGKLTVSDISAALIEYESRNKSEANPDGDLSVYFAKSGIRGKGKFSKDSDGANNGVTCHRCRKTGHYARDCTAPAPVQPEGANFAGHGTFEW